jgi:uncharacterized membrane protein YphA (DoxX/SURF4 family)
VLAGARIFLGYLYIVTWNSNREKGLFTTEGWAGFVQWIADGTTMPFVSEILNTVVIPNAAVLSKANMGVELVIFGIFLLVGFLTPPSAVLSAGFSLALLLTTWGTGEWWGTYGLAVALSLVLGLCRSGRTLGIDAYLARRNPHPRLPLY